MLLQLLPPPPGGANRLPGGPAPPLLLLGHTALRQQEAQPALRRCGALQTLRLRSQLTSHVTLARRRQEARPVCRTVGRRSNKESSTGREVGPALPLDQSAASVCPSSIHV